MKNFILSLLMLLILSNYLAAQNTKELVLVGTGYGLTTDPNHPNGLAQWHYLQKFANITHNGQNASVTAFRMYVDWPIYEPTEGNYQRARFRQAVEAALSLNNNTMKIALHFPYQVDWNFTANPNSWASDADLARTHTGQISGDHFYRAPSLYNERVRSKFYNFVSDALNQISDYHNRILYVVAGNGNAEEFGQPYAKDPISGLHTVAMHDSWATNAWRTEYLPCRYPGQSTVTWNGNTHNISNAPLAGQYGSHYSNWNDEHGREFHRFGSWGIQRFYKGFRDIVKSKNSNLKVLYYSSDFGGMQGNLIHFHGSSLPMILQEYDGIFGTPGDDVHTFSQKVMATDIIKSTNPNKIAAMDVDPVDLGMGEPWVPHQNIIPGMAEEWFPRLYKHGIDYINISMHYWDNAIETLKPALALVRANYIDVPYTPPARQTPATTVNIFPTSFTGDNLFHNSWKNVLNGDNWSVTDNTPVSLRMIDDGYWQNIWSCTPVDPCTFTVGASGPSGNVNTNASVTLNSSCTGSQCTGVTYSWSGHGISGSGSSVTFNAPATAGSYTYTVTASKSSCSNKTATVTVNVVNPADPCAFTISTTGPSGNVAPSSSVTLGSSCTGACTGVSYAWSGHGISGSGNSVTFNAPATPGTYTYTVTASKSSCSNKTATRTVTVDNGGSNPCNFTEKGVVGTWNSLQVQTRQFTINGQPKWAVVVVVPTTPNVDRHFPRGDNFVQRGDVSWTNGPVQKSCLGAGDTGWDGLSFPSGITVPTGYVQGTMPDGAVYFELAPTNCNFNISASGPTGNVTASTSVTLSSTCTGPDCSGVSYAWSGHGISGSSSSVTFNASATPGNYTYTVTASKSGCSNKTATHSITVVTGGTVNCNSVSGHFDIANCSTLSGWAWDETQPNTPIRIELYSSNTLVQSNILADNFRQDLLNNGMGNGNHGFNIPVPSALRNGGSHWLTFKVQGCSFELYNSPKNINGCTGSPAVLSPIENDNTQKALTVFPNPSNGNFETSFYLERGKKATMVLTDVQGRILMTKTLVGNGSHLEKINLNNKATGTLFLRLIKDNTTEMKKISVIR